jgi:hypothetical protein
LQKIDLSRKLSGFRMDMIESKLGRLR